MWIGKYDGGDIQIDDGFFEQLKESHLQPVVLVFERFEIFEGGQEIDGKEAVGGEVKRMKTNKFE